MTPTREQAAQILAYRICQVCFKELVNAQSHDYACYQCFNKGVARLTYDELVTIARGDVYP
jgi:hypothetical protein